MSMRLLMTLAVGLALAGPALSTEDPKPETLETLLEKLHGQEVTNFAGNLNEIPLFELLQVFTKRYELTFVINEESFRAEGVQDIKTKTPNLAITQVRGMTVHELLTTVLDSVGATYIIKGKTIEIVPPAYAAKLTKANVTESEDGRKRLAEPLVSAVFKEKPLNEAVAVLAERHDLTVIIAPQAGDARTGFVNARLLNIPADRALELLAIQGDLGVVRKGSAYLITSREHAHGMFAEKMERERAKIELEKFRASPPPKPEAPPPQPKAELLPGAPGTFRLELVPPPKREPKQ